MRGFSNMRHAMVVAMAVILAAAGAAQAAAVTTTATSALRGPVEDAMDRLRATRSPPTGPPAWAVSPEGLEFDGNTHISLAGFAGFPKGSCSVLFTMRTLPDPFLPATPSSPAAASTGLASDGTMLSVWSSLSESVTFSLSSTANLAIHTGTKRVKTGLKVGDGTWHQIAVTFSAEQQEIKTYIDGRPSFSTSLETNTRSLFNGSSTLVFAQMQGCAGGCFDTRKGLRARIRHLSLWSRPLSQEEVRTFGTGVWGEAQGSPGLVLAYPMINGTGSTVRDVGRHRLHASMAGATVVAAGEGQTFYLNGQSFLSRQIPRGTFPDTAVTLTMWYQGLEALQGGTFVSYSTTDDVDSLVIRGAGGISVEIYGVLLTTTQNVADGAWHHIAVSADAETQVLQVFVDGASKGSTRLPALLLPTFGELVVGQHQGCKGGCFVEEEGLVGFVTGFRVYDVGMTTAEVAADMALSDDDIATADNMVLSWTANGLTSSSIYTANTALSSSSSLPSSSSSSSSAGVVGVLGTPVWVSRCPNNCTAPNGICNTTTGACTCVTGVTGEDCSEGCPFSCHNHGTCVDKTCDCFPMFEGDTCQTVKNDALRARYGCSAPTPVNWRNRLKFCNMIDHPISEQAAKVHHHLDEQAALAYYRLAPQCPGSSYGKKLMKSVVCGALFPACFDQHLHGICGDMCLRISDHCNVGLDVCGLSAFDSLVNASINCTRYLPDDSINDCLHNCSGRGVCRQATCQCDVGWTGPACDESTCENAVRVANPPAYCKEVDYLVPRQINLTVADRTARRAFDRAVPFCPYSLVGREAMRLTLCATSHHMCTPKGDLKPCRSNCIDYGKWCGIEGNISCFHSDFYSDSPNCFDILKMTNFRSRFNLTTPAPPNCHTHYNCSNGGICGANGTCLCPPPIITDGGGYHGWTGKRCQQVLSHCPSRCNSNGVCTRGRCACLPSYYGASCDHQDPDLCDHGCLATGLSVDRCCRTEADAQATSLAARAGYCGGDFNCNGRGDCINRTVCVCDPGYGGLGCSNETGHVGCPYGCSGDHGDCVESPTKYQTHLSDPENTAPPATTCVCKAGWTGNGCSVPHPCPNNCSRHGTCKNGMCLCEPQHMWMGIDCGLKAPVCGIHFQCQNGGACIDKVCRCRAGWAGLRCDERDTRSPMCGRDFYCVKSSTIQCNQVTGECECGAEASGRECQIDKRPLGSTSIEVTEGHLELIHLEGRQECTAEMDDEAGQMRCRHQRANGGYAAPPFSFTGRAPFSVEFWFSATMNRAGAVVEKKEEYGVEFVAVDSPLKVSDGGVKHDTDAASFPLDTWTHVALVSNHSDHSLRVYINGQPSGVFPRTQDRPGGKYNLHIGGKPVNAFAGKVAEVRTWKAARSGAQLRWAMHRRLRAPATIPTLAGYWDFASADNIDADSSPNTGNANIKGTVIWINGGPPVTNKTHVHPPPLPLARETSNMSCRMLCQSRAPSSDCVWSYATPVARAEGVCSTSKVGTDGICDTTDFASASRTCHAMSARLCSADELVNGITTQTDPTVGCGHDAPASRVWSSTPCSVMGADGMMGPGVIAVSGTDKPLVGELSEYCSPVGGSATAHGVRCCADRVKPSVEAPPLARSCRDASVRQMSNTAGHNTSGEYALQPTPSGQVIQMFCQQDLAGGGWMLVANVPANSPTFLNLTDPFDPDAELLPENYNSKKWVHEKQYFVPFAGLADTAQVMMATGDATVWCVLDRLEIYKGSTEILDSNGFMLMPPYSNTTTLGLDGLVKVTCGLGHNHNPNSLDVLWGPDRILGPNGTDAPLDPTSISNLLKGGSDGPFHVGRMPIVPKVRDVRDGMSLFISSEHKGPPRAVPPPPASPVDDTYEAILNPAATVSGSPPCLTIDVPPDFANYPTRLLVSPAQAPPPSGLPASASLSLAQRGAAESTITGLFPPIASPPPAVYVRSKTEGASESYEVCLADPNVTDTNTGLVSYVLTRGSPPGVQTTSALISPSPPGTAHRCKVVTFPDVFSFRPLVQITATRKPAYMYIKSVTRAEMTLCAYRTPKWNNIIRPLPTATPTTTPTPTLDVQDGDGENDNGEDPGDSTREPTGDLDEPTPTPSSTPTPTPVEGVDMLTEVEITAYDRVPGIGGESGQLPIPLPPPGQGTIQCVGVNITGRYRKQLTIVTTLVQLAARDGTDGGGYSWVENSTRRNFTVCVDNPTFSNLALNWAAVGRRLRPQDPPEYDPTPASCSEAQTMRWPSGPQAWTRGMKAKVKEVVGAMPSGLYTLKNTDKYADNDYLNVYCDMGSTSGGWSLVANAAAGTPFPSESLGQGPDAFNGTVEITPDAYVGDEWVRNKTYAIRSAQFLTEGLIRFTTGDGNASCEMNVSDIRRWSGIGGSPDVPIVDSTGTTATTGELTAVVNELPMYGGRLLVACEGDFPDNVKKVLWGYNGKDTWDCFKDAHDGVGVFVK